MIVAHLLSFEKLDTTTCIRPYNSILRVITTKKSKKKTIIKALVSKGNRGFTPSIEISNWFLTSIMLTKLKEVTSHHIPYRKNTKADELKKLASTMTFGEHKFIIFYTLKVSGVFQDTYVQS